MPLTPYHFGPSGFIGLIFRKYIDIPVFVLANVAVDVEVLTVVLLGLGRPVHRYFHTLLVGAAVGAVWAIVAYPMRNIFKKIMRWLRVSYQTSFLKMLISGILGVWFHVTLDSIYHGDVRMLWPSRARPLYRLISQGQMEAVCVAFFIAAVVPYILAVKAFSKKNKSNEDVSAQGNDW